MNFDKTIIFQDLIKIISEELEVCIRAANSAHEAATHEELVAENKYDTKGLEASYLAGAQARRANELQIDIDEIKKIQNKKFSEDQSIDYSSLVQIEDEDGMSKFLLLVNRAGGYKIPHQEIEIQSITPASPLGQKLWKKRLDDEIELKVQGKSKYFSIISHY
ncbi:MAG: transcription elongation factor GreAB [Bdellovibrionota bacterium]|nr:transcription elongation factor GreAB [Bdellovibrionota bacterium]